MSTSYYTTDLAWVHDRHFSGLAKGAARMLIKMLKAAGHSSGQVVDLGCGSGVLAGRVEAAGYDIIGVDTSSDILEIARHQAPEATFVQASVWDFDMPPCIAVTAIGEIFTYLFDERNTDDRLVVLFEEIYNTLLPGGFFVFDLISTGVLGEESCDVKMIEKDDWTMFVQYAKDKYQRTLTRDIQLFRKQLNGLYRKSREVHHVKLLDPDEITRQLESIGFRVELIDQYDGYAFREGHVGFVAFK